MKLHIFDNIADGSKEIADFRSLLDDSLHFNYKVPDLTYDHNNTSYIDTIFGICDSICHYLFHIKGAYNFFGSPDSSVPDIQYPDLCFSSDFWLSSIKYHCVVSSLYTFLYFLLKDMPISFYKLFIHAQGLGYFALIEQRLLYKENNSLRFKPHVSSGNGVLSTPMYFKDDLSNFRKTYSRFYDKLSKNEQAILGYNPKDHSFSCLNLDLNYRLWEVRKELFHYRNPKIGCSKKSLIISYKEFLSHAKILREHLNESSSVYYPNIVDSIIFKYKVERYYNLSFTDCIVTMLLNFSNQNDNCSIDSVPWEILSTCFYLPNVFSRETFFKFALHSFNNICLEDSIFFKRYQDTGPMSFLGNSTSNNTRLLTWLDLFRKYNIFFSHIIFPIYEKCFFILLKDSLTQDISHDDNAFLFKAIDILHNYISIHSRAITGQDNKDPDIANLLQTDGFQNSETFKIDPSDQKEAALLTQKMLIKQNNIIHPVPSPLLNPDYLGFTPGNIYHRQLMNLAIDSIMNNIHHIF